MKNKNIFDSCSDEFIRMTATSDPLNEDELKSYIKSFTNCVNKVLNEQEIHNVMNNSKKNSLHRKSAGRLKIIAISAFIVLVINIIVALTFILTSSTFINYNISTIIIILLDEILLFFGVKLSVDNLHNYYMEYKNLKDIKVGELYIFDRDGMNVSFEERDIENIPVVHHSYPMVVQVISISNKYIHLLDPSAIEYDKPMFYTISVKDAYLLSYIEETRYDMKNLIIRYPYNLPMFTRQDTSVLEAALILAKNANEEKVYDYLSELIGKVRFYYDKPFCVYEDARKKYERDLNNAKKYLEDITDLMTEDDEEDDEFDIDGDIE